MQDTQGLQITVLRNIFTKRKKYYKMRVSYEDMDLIV